jgi:hypothetical protein
MPDYYDFKLQMSYFVSRTRGFIFNGLRILIYQIYKYENQSFFIRCPVTWTYLR